MPARFDWSIMGWTILLRALMNLKEKRGAIDEGKGGRVRDKDKIQAVNALFQTTGQNVAD